VSRADELARLFERLVADQVEPLEQRVTELERDNPPRWLTLDQAAARLGCSPDAVRMRVKRGRLEHRYQGRRLYVSADAVDRL
jgi:excisionase family DNA binding protein